VQLLEQPPSCSEDADDFPSVDEDFVQNLELLEACAVRDTRGHVLLEEFGRHGPGSWYRLPDDFVNQHLETEVVRTEAPGGCKPLLEEIAQQSEPTLGARPAEPGADTHVNADFFCRVSTCWLAGCCMQSLSIKPSSFISSSIFKLACHLPAD